MLLTYHSLNGKVQLIFAILSVHLVYAKGKQMLLVPLRYYIIDWFLFSTSFPCLLLGRVLVNSILHVFE